MALREGPRFLERVAWGIGLLAGAVLLMAAWHGRDVLLLALAGILVALMLRKPADWLSERTRIPAPLAVGLVTLALVGIVVGTFWWQGGAIGSQAAELRQQIPVAVERIETDLRGTSWGRTLLEHLPAPSEILPEGAGALQQATGALSRTFGVLANLLVVVFLGLVLALSPEPYVRGIVRLVPPARRDRAREILARLASTLRWWLVGRLLSMSIVGVLTFIGLVVLDVPLALVLAVLAAILTFIPNVGPLIALVPAVLLGLVQSPRLALAVLGLYLAVQLVETYVLAPVIDQKTVYLPPALTVLAQIAMALVAGLLGVALATPLLAAVVVLVTALYVEDTLGDAPAAPRDG